MATRSAEDLTFSGALPIATPRPAHSIMSMSLGLSPTATTSSLFTPRDRGQVAERRSLAPVRVADFAEVIVGVHSGQGAVEVGIHHGRNVAYGPCVSGDNYLGRRRLDAPDEVADRVRLNLQDFLVPAHGLGHFPDVEVVSHEDVGVEASVFEEANEPVGEVERNGGLADDLVGDGVGGEGALVADYGQRDTQGTAEWK